MQVTSFLRSFLTDSNTKRVHSSSSNATNSELVYVANYMYYISSKSVSYYQLCSFSTSFFQRKALLHPIALTLSQISFIGNILNDVLVHYKKHNSFLFLNAIE